MKGLEFFWDPIRISYDMDSLRLMILRSDFPRMRNNLSVPFGAQRSRGIFKDFLGFYENYLEWLGIR